MSTVIAAAARLRHAGRVVAAGAVVVVAVVTGVGATLAAALINTRPAVFLTAGLVVTEVVAAGGLRWVLGGWSRRRRFRVTAVVVGGLLVLGVVGALAPLPDPRPPLPPVPGLSFWDLDTGSRLAYVRLAGAAPRRPTPVVVLHGGPGVPDMAGDTASFAPLTALGFDVYVYDQLGSGRSARLPDPSGYSTDRDVADLESVRSVIGAETMVLIGHSAGGALAGHYLAAHPDHVAKLVLSSPGPLDPSDRSTDRAIAGLGTAMRVDVYTATLAPRALLGYLLLQVDPVAANAYLPAAEADAHNDVILSLAEPALHCTPAQSHGPVHGSSFYRLQYPQSRAAPPAPDVRPTLTGLATPVLILKGSCDYLSWRSATEYRRVLPNSTLVYLDGAGHNTYQDRPAQAQAAVSAFLTDRPLPLPPYPTDAVPAGFTGPS